MKELAQAIFDQLYRGTLDLIEFGDNTATVQVIFNYRDEIVTLKSLKPALKPFGVIDVWADKCGTTVGYNLRLKDTPSDESKQALQIEIARLFAEA
jgi:hypothetical protein